MTQPTPIRRSRLRVLDAYSCIGGAARGYQYLGWHVTGVDINPQPDYCGDVFHQGDAIEFIREHGHEFDFIHTSPPCQGRGRRPRERTPRATHAPVAGTPASSPRPAPPWTSWDGRT